MMSITEREAEGKVQTPRVCRKCGLDVDVVIDGIVEAVEAGEKLHPLYGMLLESHRKTCLEARP